MKVLIVDDEPVARRVLIEELQCLSDITIAGEASNGAEALEKITMIAPDLVLLDLQMPVLTGLEVLCRLPSNNPPVVIVITAFDQHVRAALDSGAADYLMKPVDGNRLIGAIEAARRRLQMASAEPKLQ